MDVTIVRDLEFIPRWGQNEKLPAKDQIKVRIKAPTVEDRDRAAGVETMLDENLKPKIELREDHIALVRRHCVAVSNLRVTDETGEVTNITDGNGLLRCPGLHLLVEEIGQKIGSLVAEPDHVDPPLGLPSGSGAGASSKRTPRRVN